MARETIKVLKNKLSHTEHEFFKESNKIKANREEFLKELRLLRDSLKISKTETSEKKQRHQCNEEVC